MDELAGATEDGAADTAPWWTEWRGRVDSPAALAACVDALGLLPLAAPAGWPGWDAVLAGGVTTAAAWAWAGALVSARQVFAGRVLPGLASVCLTALPIFTLAFARTPGSDPLRAYTRGQYGLTGKAVVELLLARGPLTVQQIRLGLGQHKRFLIHDTAGVLAELERALVVVAGDAALAVEWRQGPVQPRSRFNPPPTADLDLRVWELTARWAPPAALAAADRLRERPGAARTLLRERLAALHPRAAPAPLDALLGEDGTDEPQTPA